MLAISERRIAFGVEERRLGRLRRAIEREARAAGLPHLSIPSLSTRTIVYKGLVRGRRLGEFYKDLLDPRVRSAFALFHERFSTNTFPAWSLAQPFNLTAHNGEINTIGGNRAWLRAREQEILKRAAEQRDSARADDARLFDRAGSDSKTLDELIGRLTDEGYLLDEAVLALVPAAYETKDVPEPVRSFYRYHARRFEPFDGPACLVFADGERVGACLDRNGLRPARIAETIDGLVVVSSEAGIADLPPASIKRLHRLGPGQAIVCDLTDGRVLHDRQLKRLLSVHRPYGAWLRGSQEPRPVSSRPSRRPQAPGTVARLRLAFGLTEEELSQVVVPMARDGKQAVGSMGDDTPHAVLSRVPRPLAHFFSQRFSQVTNPPIDPHRERAVMSLVTVLGPRPPLLEAPGPLPRHVELEVPLLDHRALRGLRELRVGALASHEVSAIWPVHLGATGLKRALERLGDEARDAVARGRGLVIASDEAVTSTHAPIPSVLVAGTLHQALAEAGLRHRASIICAAGDVWDAHSLAICLGAGADAVAPHLAFASVRARARDEGSDLAQALGNAPDAAVKATLQYRKALLDGLLQVMAKMGISTVSGYRGARLFEALGLDADVVETCLPGTPSRIGGLGFTEIAEDLAKRHRAAFAAADPGAPDPGPLLPLASKQGASASQPPALLSGFYRYRKNGESHAITPTVMKSLQRACRQNDPAAYQAYTDALDQGPPLSLRQLLRFRFADQPLPLEEVEPMEAIRKRFCGAAMSIGALSKEMHEALAIALNRIGGRSNSGEGGEDPTRFHTERESRIKQVASARFGVTTHYLASAEELEIKMAQGSKPGEGGHLPGIKVSVEIARLRHAMPGRTLISPPPHHDIYSIEDLAQLIFDLKQVNPRARIVVKLVSEFGVGTVAAGVVKAFADTILVSGANGGTGASPLGSIKFAGLPWELGLAETQQTLVRSGLRGRVSLRTDGGLRRGRDVMIAALLGAESFGFGTMPLIAAGCVMQRRCHLNTCSVGVATQREDLRARFSGTPDHIIRFFTFVATEVRGLLARLGLPSLDAAIGRTDLLESAVANASPRAQLIDLSRILAPSAGPAEGTGEPAAARRAKNARNDVPSWQPRSPDGAWIESMTAALDRGETFEREAEVENVHRAIGTRLGGEFVQRLINRGEADHIDRVPHRQVVLRLRGTAGQSLGAFLPRGMSIELIGAANDYVGKGLCGGEIVIRPDPRAERVAAAPHEHTIIGNTILYGATSGTLLVAGRAGERFCVRNSGAIAVCEGAGDHAFEYMTGGVALCLGEFGDNLGAGMTGGIVYLFDPKGQLEQRLNPELVLGLPLDPKASLDAVAVQELLQRHRRATQSPRATEILENWGGNATFFRKVVPRGAAGDPLVQRALASQALQMPDPLDAPTR
jgi:glutamate synthase domain-containing protein 2/glutamate synthase domain-containing protein 3